MSEMWRVFVALELPAPALRAIGKVQDDFNAKAPRRALRPTNSEGIHLTLKFLGDAPAEQIDAIRAALAEAARATGPFELAVEGMGCFPNTRAPRVVWLGVGGDLRALKHLRGDVERQISPLGYPTEQRPFNPHLTLARVQGHAAREEVTRIGELVARLDVGEIARWRAQSVSLMRSQLQRGGAIYTRIGEAALEPASP